MAIIKCKMCGGDLEVVAESRVAVCEYCGTQQTVPSADNEKKLTLFGRANRLRMACEFDKAAGVYESIVADFPEESEAYWGLVLCKYGIEYVDDPATGKKIPTCHRSSFDSVMDDSNLDQALENADAIAQKVYREEAKQFERIRKGILEVSSSEKPYDIFICYKETDEKGDRTLDSVMAQDLYAALTDKGYRVFFSRITLQGKLGEAYEPYIFAALNSAKVMLAVGTCYEYYNAVWVKNEWSRYLKICEADKSKHLIPCYKDLDPEDMPREFKHLQGADLGKMGVVQDILFNMEKYIPLKKETVKETVVVQQVQDNATAPLLKRVFMFLEDGDWNRADDFCEQVLNIDPECAEAYLGKLMVDLRVKTRDGLKGCSEPFDGNNNYQKAVRFADEKLKTALTGYIEHINTRNENARLDGIYTRAKNAMSAANTESAYKEAAHLFESISEYQDSATLAQSCYEKAEVSRKDAILAEGKAKMTGEVISNYESAIKLFESISGWKDADEKICACQKKIEEIKAKVEAERLEKERKAEIARKEAERKAKRNKKIAIITTPIVCAIIAFIIVLNTVIIPNGKYNDAIALMDAGKYSEAISAFEAMDGYKDSISKIEECNINIYGEEVWNKIKAVNVGDIYSLGAYEQDNNKSNGQEDIEWLVLAKEGTKILVISKHALDCKPYNTSYTAVTWETCTLRKWLNNDFINVAFSADEKTMIPTVTVSADKNPEYSTNPGNATQDQVFLLSITEANKYFSSDSARQCEPTDFAVANGAWESNSGTCWWRLRSPGYSQRNAANVLDVGDVYEHGFYVDHATYAVRPAMWIDLGA